MRSSPREYRKNSRREPGCLISRGVEDGAPHRHVHQHAARLCPSHGRTIGNHRGLSRRQSSDRSIREAQRRKAAAKNGIRTREVISQLSRKTQTPKDSGVPPFKKRRVGHLALPKPWAQRRGSRRGGRRESALATTAV